MKKSTALSIIACALVSNTTSLSMLRTLGAQKHQHVRMCHTKNSFFKLREKNIFNASKTEASTQAPYLLEDLYDRNNSFAEHLLKEIEGAQKIMKTLEHQNNIAINHTYHEETLNTTSLKLLESRLITDIEMHLKTRRNIHQFIIAQNKAKGHENE